MQAAARGHAGWMSPTKAEVGSAVGWAADRLDGLDLMVNSAGVLSVAPVVELEAREWRRVLEVNATGAFLVSRAAARIMIEAPGRRRSSRSPRSPGRSASRAWRITRPRSSRSSASPRPSPRELAPHEITVNAVCPGVVATPMIERAVQPVARLHRGNGGPAGDPAAAVARRTSPWRSPSCMPAVP